MLARATDVRQLAAFDGKSGALLEQVTIDGAPHVVKRVAYANDWLMQAIGDTSAAAVKAWSAGIMTRLPDCIDHATVGMEAYDTGAGITVVIVMRDVTAGLVAEGDVPISLEQHHRFLDHMAALHAQFWGWTDDVGLIPLRNRYLLMTRPTILRARAASPDALVPPLILEGWERLRTRAPSMADTLFALHADPSPLVRAVAATPQTFLHGDWKMGNLGSHPDGRTILVDWSLPGAGPPCTELVHYIALNRSRMPESKEAAIAAYRAGLESRGIATDGWWDRQVALTLLGVMTALGWEKALGDDDELEWWTTRVAEGAALL